MGELTDISHRFLMLKALADATQFNVLAVDYRGYGRSTGVPSEAGLERDAEAMLRALAARRDIDTQRIIVLGQGLGGALAVHLATHARTRGLFQALVLENVPASVPAMAQALLPRVLAPWARATHARFDALARLRRPHSLAVPALFVATADDEVVPHAQMRQLYAAARAHATPAARALTRMVCFPGTEHHNVARIAGAAYYRALLEWACAVLLHDTRCSAELAGIENDLAPGGDCGGAGEQIAVPECVCEHRRGEKDAGADAEQSSAGSAPGKEKAQ